MNDYEFWAARYQSQAQWTEQTRQFILKQINLPTQAKILEVGCGSLAVLKGYEIIGHQTFGVDIDYSILKYSKQQTKSGLINSDGYSLPLNDEIFDLCFCHYLLLWLQEPAKLLQEMKRVTKDNGWICCFAEPDYLSRIDAPSPLDKLGEIQNQSLIQQGINLTAGREVTGWLSEINLTSINWGIIAANQSANTMHSDSDEWTTIKKDIDSLIPLEEIDMYRRIVQDAQSRGIHVLFIPTFYAYAQK
ncbi:MAG TPA: class I SAM-dependent methyltransferase [Anaerolineaceae bacterium]|nr:class I SAM-dependent methyltransferase [Anaerolineaceae bacterium]